MNLSNRPHVALWLDVSDSCHMTGEFELGNQETDDIHFIMGHPKDEVHLRFERAALERFVELATRMLALPESADPRADRPKLESPAA